MDGYMMKKILFLTTITLITGCGDDVITTLKKSTILEYPAYTYGQILDNRVLCEDTKWDEAKTHNGVTEITYSCKLKQGINPPYSFDLELGQKVYDKEYQIEFNRLDELKKGYRLVKR